MNIEQLAQALKNDSEFMDCVTHWETLPAMEAKYADFPEHLDPRLKEVLTQKGIRQLYTHQREAYDLASAGKNFVVVTPTASGKTLCYNLPVLNTILSKPDSRALYLFPTKALSQDQVGELYETITALEADIKTFTFDGDTPQNARKKIREAGHIVVTNPDMLHSGILPHHTRWIKLFENLKFVVIDELHHYRGVFGSHLANVIRRLKRLLKFYNTEVQFICSSATIANPVELAERILEEKVELIDKNGAPRAQKHFIFYNPPVVNQQLGIRRSAVLSSKNIACKIIANDIQTIVFVPYRTTTEILLTYLRNSLGGHINPKQAVFGYRGGYLPNERRRIEKGLKSGQIRAVVSTNALELGIDIGQLEAAILTGYPGSIASTLQQAGRAGRKRGLSLVVLVANSSALNQFIVNHAEYIFKQPFESGVVDPNNFVILTSHIKCAAFELPFEEDEKFGVETTTEILRYLAQKGILRETGGKFHWTSDVYPANELSLRSAINDNFVILNSSNNYKVIGEMDLFSTPEMLHPQAIYLHGAAQYQVEELDWEGRKAIVKEVDVDYFTDAESKTDLKILTEEKKDEPTMSGWGEITLTTVTVLFKKVKFFTHENVGSGKVSLPEIEMSTTSFWQEFPLEIYDKVKIDREKMGEVLRGMANCLGDIAPLYILCDRKDIGSISNVKAKFSEKPTLYLYDRVPGGVGFSEKIFTMKKEIYKAARYLIKSCPCEAGCPSCIGPPPDNDPIRKNLAVTLFDYLIDLK
jgi:DEAD/DEAH box helicase domain-containing protein